MPPTQSQFGEMGGKFMKSQGLSQLYHNQSQGLLSQLQGQSKGMPPRFSKKGQLNADEVHLPMLFIYHSLSIQKSLAR